jgi:hypothetical protein
MNPAVLATIAAAVGGAFGKVFLSLATSLLTEVVIKKVTILLLEKIAAKTESDLDNQLLVIAKEAWEAPKLPAKDEP